MVDTNGFERASPACFANERHLHVDMSPKSDIKDISIAIIGAGMGGLGCALSLAKKGFRNISVYEAASDLGFVGAGIQMAPNMVRILDRLGCWKKMLPEVTNVRGSSIRKGATNEELSFVPMPNIEELYGYPHTADHRSSLTRALYDACKEESSIKFHFSTSLLEVTSFEPCPAFRVQPRGAQPYTVRTDVLLASDGIKSPTRKAILDATGFEGQEEETGQAAYRIMLKREDMESDPEMKALIDGDIVTRWIGEKRHIIAYSVADKNIYNLSTTQPDKNFAAALDATYTTRGSKSAMLDVFSDFCPLVHKMLNLVPEGEVCEWRLRMHKPLATWTHGPVALLGDACHPTLPHLSQGAAMAVEDGAVVAEVLAMAPDTYPETLARCLKAYELSRKEWCTRLVELAFFSGRTLHLGEGKAKEERDRQFAEAKARGEGAVPDKWASPEVQKMIFSNDCVKNIREEFAELFKSTAGAEAGAETKVEGQNGTGESAKRKRCDGTPAPESGTGNGTAAAAPESPKKVRTENGVAKAC